MDYNNCSNCSRNYSANNDYSSESSSNYHTSNPDYHSRSPAYASHSPVSYDSREIDYSVM